MTRRDDFKASALSGFRPDESLAKSLVHGAYLADSPSEEGRQSDLDLIWNLLDYGWLSDAARPSSAMSSTNESSGITGDTRESPAENSRAVDPIDWIPPNTSGPSSLTYPFDATIDNFSYDSYDTWSEVIEGGDTIVPLSMEL